jgi:hypothetical protein
MAVSSVLVRDLRNLSYLMIVDPKNTVWWLQKSLLQVFWDGNYAMPRSHLGSGGFAQTSTVEYLFFATCTIWRFVALNPAASLALIKGLRAFV